MTRDLIRYILVGASTIATIIINYLANALPINGVGTGEVSDQLNALFVPAGYVFSIWGLIYIGLIGFSIYHFLPVHRDKKIPGAADIAYIISCLANSVWIFLWHYQQFPLTLIAMAVILISLVIIYLDLDIGRYRADVKTRWLVHIPFSLYLGWISVATVANIAQTLTYTNWNGWGLSPSSWMIIMLVVVVLLAVIVTWKRRDFVFIAVFVWAFVGIAIKHSDTSLVFTGSWISAAIGVILIVYSVFKRRGSAF